MNALKITPLGWSRLLLVLTTLIWGTTFPLLKDSVSTLSATALVGGRFIVAALVLLPFCRRLNRRLVRDGVLLGAIAFVSYVTQAIGLETTSANRGAFITSLNVIIVPLLGLLLGQLASRQLFVAAGLALVGIGVMSWESGAWVVGDGWVLGCAISYALLIVLVERIAPNHDPLALTAVQLTTMALMATLWAAPEWISSWPGLIEKFGAIAYLGLIATAFTTWSQVVAQRRVAATEAALIYTLEPVFAAGFSFIWLGERLGLRGLLGAAIVLVAMVLSQLPFKPRPPSAG